MPSRTARIASRLAFFLCGAVSVLISRVYWALQGLAHAYSGFQGHWSLFSGVLLGVGALAVVVALLPSSWIERGGGTHNEQPSLIPIKMLASFALFSYILTVALDFAPLGWHPDPQLAFLICPACALTITVDPAFGTVLLLLAPLNAAVYGALGGGLGCLSVAVRNRVS